MKKTYAYIIISSLILFNALISSLSRLKDVPCFLSAPSLGAPHLSVPEPNLAFFFVSASAAAYEGKKTESDKIAAPVIGEAKEPIQNTAYDDALPENIKETTVIRGRETLLDIEVNNETPYNLAEAYQKPHIEPEADGPSVLILHTHTSESYRPSAGFDYIPTDNDRTEDLNFNVARVGSELCKSLNALGIYAVHDPTICDYPSYNGSYKKMLSVAEAALKKYPSIKTVIDLHRDAMETTDGTKISTVANINGEKAAQIMFVVGTDANGLYHPTWQSNFSFAADLQKKCDEMYPSLARPLNVRCERFNGHISPYEILIEVGTTGNTLPEALVSARAAANVIASVMSDS